MNGGGDQSTARSNSTTSALERALLTPRDKSELLEVGPHT